ncbi:MAG: hypothetical protein AAGK14_08005 [Verrucomicrobiota bacterium]
MLPSLFRLIPCALLLAAIPLWAQPEDLSVFGTKEVNRAALIGILYDLKQDQAHNKKEMNTRIYGEIIDEFLSKKWDESVLNRYYRVTQPLYTTQVYIPLMRASGAPRAFEVEDTVKPSYWLIHYKGQVSAPSDGEWRFWGWGEECCSVAINGEIVLLANWHEIKTPNVDWESPEPDGMKIANGHLTAGSWFRLEKGEVVDLDILIGERAGGVFCSFLLIEKRGETYGPRVADNQPLLPVFQLAPFPTVEAESTKQGPPIARDGPIWNAVQ